MTNYWDKLDKGGFIKSARETTLSNKKADLEIQQGKNIADTAQEAGVQHFIFSSLLDINKRKFVSFHIMA